MNRFSQFIAVVLLAFLAVLPASAQDGTFGLGDTDFQAFTSANATSATKTQYSFDYEVTLTVQGAGFPIDVALTGTGAVDVDNNLASVTIDGTATVAGQVTPIEAELRVVDNLLYVRATDPTTNSDTGWFSLNVDDLASADLGSGNFGEDLTDAFLQGFAQGAGVDQADFDEEAFNNMVVAIASLDPEDFIFISRNADTFTIDFNIPALAEAPGFEVVTRELLQASAIAPDADPQFVDIFNQILADAFAATSITFDQTIDPASGLVQGATFTIDSTIDPADFDSSGSPIVTNFVLDISLSGYDTPASVTAPADALEIPSSVVTDALGIEAGAGAGAPSSSAPDTMPDTAMGAAQAVTLDCSTQALAFDGGVGSVYAGTCPAGCTAGSLWGTRVYTDDSAICTAAIHAGTIGESGGDVTFVIEDGMDSYPASAQNGISSSEWGSWGRSFSFSSGSAGMDAGGTDMMDAAGDSDAAMSVAGDMANSYAFANGVSFGYPEGYTIMTESDVVTVVIAESQRAFIQAYETRFLFGETDLGVDFVKQTAGTTAASTWGFDYDPTAYQEMEVNGRQMSVMEFEGVQNGEPVVGAVAVVTYDGGGYGYVLSYALPPVPGTFIEDTLAVASTLNG